MRERERGERVRERERERGSERGKDRKGVVDGRARER